MTHPIKNKILFTSFFGKQYSDNPRAISERIHEVNPGIEIVWYLNDRNDPYGLVPSYIRVVSDKRKLPLKFYRELATSFCYVTNANLEADVFKRKKQFFVQTWHGDRAFKRILYDSVGENKRAVPIMDNKYADIAVSGSDFGTQVYRSAFKYEGKIIECGSPRNDALLANNDSLIQKIKERLCIHDEKILLYAPTFRDKNRKAQHINVDLQRVINILTETSGNKWICMIRSHPGACKLDNTDQSFTLDVSDYPDMADLLCITDYLITDYSSSILDFYLTGRPSVCIAFDEKEYEEGSRRFKVSPQNTGLIIARSQEELEGIIRYTTINEYLNAYKKVDEVYGTKESGIAGMTIASIINEYYVNSIES